MMINSFSHFTKIKLDSKTPGRILFPGVDNLPEKSFGYIRSKRLEANCLTTTRRHRPEGVNLPYKDYSPNVVVDVADFLSVCEGVNYHLVISARNILNETGFAIRFNDKWYFRQTGALPPESWPVLSLGEEGIQFEKMQDVDGRNNVVSGVPVVIDGHAVTRNFLIKHCSDVAHTFEVHPKGWIGPSAIAWHELSELWQELWDTNTPENEFAQKMEQLASRHKANPSKNLLHSIAAKDKDGNINFFAVTGSLDSIAGELAKGNEIEQAVILDNGGSVGYMIYTPNATTGKQCSFNKQVLVAGPNYRPQGTVFMEFRLADFLHPGSIW